jgi:cysteine synthase A
MSPHISDSTLAGIGNTPLVRLSRIRPASSAQILVKIESSNPTGSYKDRMALAIIEEAEQRGELLPGQRIIEYSGGSTGSSLAYVCALKGYPCTIISSDAFSEEKIRTMRAFGAEVIIVPSENGLITPGLFDRMREVLAEALTGHKYYWTRQFTNTDALLGYEKLGNEILDQTRGITDPIHTFCAAVGTAGMLMGVSKALRNELPDIRITALEPETSPMITSGHGGPHRVEGIATGIYPPLLYRSQYTDARTVDEGRARQMALDLARMEGIFAGTSTALNVVAALDIAHELGPGHTVLTVACDSGLKYLTGSLYS